ncbi:site-specific integrase [Merdimmobilis hominis]|uniref:tyrosine-type recombinase/integrase n=1 Tax=Merdimmobilis hominis TaxID=2897707 RepID=UPI0034B0969F
MAKRRNQRRKDGRVAVQVYLGRREDGTREYRTVYGKTQKEADEKAVRLKLDLKKGLDVSAARDTFGEWAERWASIKSQEVSAARMTTYRCDLKHLSPLFSIPLSQVRAADLQEVLYTLARRNPTTGKPTAAKTLQGIRSVAGQIFQMAVDNRVIEYNPTAPVKIPKGQPRETRRALTDLERQWVENTPHRAQTAAMLMLYAGLRRGEVIPLTGGAVDLERREIQVNRFVAFDKGRPILKDYGKTDNSRRVVTIPQVLVNYLASVKAANPGAWGGLLCPSAHGQLMTETAWRRLWESYQRELNARYGDFSSCLTWKNGRRMEQVTMDGKDKFNPNGVPFVIRGFTAHDLRHTFATLLYFSGVDILTAKEQLGHSDVRTTMEIYTHLDKDFKRRSMDKMDEFLAASGK